MSQASEISFTQERLERFNKIVLKYETPQCALLPVMYLAQEQFGYLSAAVMEYVAKLLDIPPVIVFQVASFYTLLKKKDTGKWCLQVCNNITCAMMGSEKLIQFIEKELGIKANEVTKDGRISFMPVQCLGSCNTAPVISLNDTYIENVTPEFLIKLLDQLRNGVDVENLEELSCQA